MTKTILRVCIGGSEEIDIATRNAIQNRAYTAVVWLIQGKEFRTPPVKTKRDPVFNWRFDIVIDPEFDPLLFSTQFLHVEVIREGCSGDPGTSRNLSVVGRARIPLPKYPRNHDDPPPTSQRIPLVAADENGVLPGGHIYIKTEIGVLFGEY